MRRLFLILAIVVVVGVVAPARADEPFAHLHARLTPCPEFPDGAKVPVRYSLVGLGNASASAHGTFDWKYHKGKTIDIDLNVPSGFYEFDAQLQYDGDETHTPPPLCASPTYIGLLPGRTRIIAGEMDGEADLTPPLLIMGTLPPGYSASLVRFAQEVECGKKVMGVPSVAPDDFKTEANAYYLYDVDRRNSKQAQYGLTVTSGGQSVTFVIEATYPSPIIGSLPTSARYDISSQMFQSGLEHTPKGSAVCVGYPSTN